MLSSGILVIVQTFTIVGLISPFLQKYQQYAILTQFSAFSYTKLMNNCSLFCNLLLKYSSTMVNNCCFFDDISNSAIVCKSQCKHKGLVLSVIVQQLSHLRRNLAILTNPKSKSDQGFPQKHICRQAIRARVQANHSIPEWQPSHRSTF